MSADKTMIWVKVETRENLKRLGNKGETYDDIIKRLMED